MFKVEEFDTGHSCLPNIRRNRRDRLGFDAVGDETPEHSEASEKMGKGESPGEMGESTLP
jgi:hypothetical protein